MTGQAASRPRELNDKERARLNELREKVHAELPDLVARNQLREDARQEPTLSGALRRAVHDCRRPLHHIAREIGIEPTRLDEFLTGERNLLSDVIDRLAKAIGFELPAQPSLPVAAAAAGQGQTASSQGVSGS